MELKNIRVNIFFTSGQSIDVNLIDTNINLLNDMVKDNEFFTINDQLIINSKNITFIKLDE